MNEAQRKIAEQKRQSGENRLWNALVPLTHVGSFMNCGAHPDDERSHILSYLARNQGIRVMYSTSTRGKGGQNAIGTEAGDDLGVFRTEEMNAAAAEIPMSVHYYSARFGDEIDDFGFSTSPEETEEKWGHERVRERLVRIIREQKPDILSPTFLDTDGQHGHHRAVTRATLDAYDLAADPNAFPHQIEEGLRPWQVKKLYLSAASGRGGVYDDRDPPPFPTVSIPVGMVDPVTGATYRQMGEWSRARHMTQGMGRWYDAAPEEAHLHRLRSEIDIPQMEDDIFDGMPKTLSDLADECERVWSLDPMPKLANRLRRAGQHIDQAIKSFPDHKEVLQNLVNSRHHLGMARIDYPGVMSTRSMILITDRDQETLIDSTLNMAHRIDLKIKQLETAIYEASGLNATINWETNFVSPGQKLDGKVSIHNSGDSVWNNLNYSIDTGGTGRTPLTEPTWFSIKPGERVDINVSKTISDKTSYHLPLQKDYEQFNSELYSLTLYFPVDDRPDGEILGVDARKTILPPIPLMNVPQVSLNFEASGVYYNRLTDGDPVQATLTVEKYTDIQSDIEIGLEAPAGWTVMPPKYMVSASDLADTSTYDFVINGPTGNDRIEVTPYAICDGKRVTENVRLMDYEHIRNTCKIVPATLAVQPVDLEIPARLKVGYVDRGSDRVYYWLKRFGVDVTMLSVEDLMSQDLSGYDTIMIGIRAFAADLAAASPNLREYVENGGNLVTQYNRADDDWDNENTPPRPITIGTPSFRWRITDPNAIVAHLIPEHHLLTKPNRIDEGDWANWHQERGLYFVAEASSEYEFLLSMSDHGKEPLRGALISASIGSGWHHHCSLILHHQLEHQVAGAARLLVNLITPPDWK